MSAIDYVDALAIWVTPLLCGGNYRKHLKEQRTGGHASLAVAGGSADATGADQENHI
jgi:hypothetical protein